MSETYKIEGLKELSDQLSGLGANVGGKFLRSAAMSATLPVVKAARTGVPKGSIPHMTGRGKRATKRYNTRLVAPGFASRSIARRSKLSRDKRTASVSIGVKGEAYYAVSFLELGTKHIPKRPWLTRALERNKGAVISRFIQTLRKKIDQEVRK